MDNVGDWLYILFLIIAGISGLLGSKNKKKHSEERQEQPSREVTTEGEKGFWEILEEEMQAPRPVPASQTVTAAPAPPARKQEAKPVAEKKQTAAPRATRTQQEKESQPPTGFADAEELRRAVIYSEILNRKY